MESPSVLEARTQSVAWVRAALLLGATFDDPEDWVPSASVDMHFRSLDTARVSYIDLVRQGRQLVGGLPPRLLSSSGTMLRVGSRIRRTYAKAPTLERLRDVWLHLFHEGAIEVTVLGPNELRVEALGLFFESLAARSVLSGIIAEGVELSEGPCFVRALPRTTDLRGLCFRVAWA
jgi:hypothetical protein